MMLTIKTKTTFLIAFFLVSLLSGCAQTEEERRAEAEKLCYPSSECWKTLAPEQRKWVAQAHQRLEISRTKRQAEFAQQTERRQQKAETEKLKRELEEAQRQLEEAKWRMRNGFRY